MAFSVFYEAFPAFLQSGRCGVSPLEGVAALRPLDKLGDLTPVGEPVEPQGPWDLWLAKESEGETSPFKKFVRGY